MSMQFISAQDIIPGDILYIDVQVADRVASFGYIMVEVLEINTDTKPDTAKIKAVAGDKTTIFVYCDMLYRYVDTDYF